MKKNEKVVSALILLMFKSLWLNLKSESVINQIVRKNPVIPRSQFVIAKVSFFA